MSDLFCVSRAIQIIESLNGAVVLVRVWGGREERGERGGGERGERERGERGERGGRERGLILRG